MTKNTLPSGYYDAIVIGAGHAGCEAALALSRTGHKTLCLCITLDSVGMMPCNPAIGGTSKGHLVREIDALGGQMGIAADRCFIQSRMLNTRKGPAVRSLRSQQDKKAYSEYMKSVLEHEENLTLLQGEATEIIPLTETFSVETALGQRYSCRAVVVAAGVYLKSRIITGEHVTQCGPAGLLRSETLGQAIDALGIPMRRFKTGTPPRIDGNTIDYSKMSIQNGDVPVVPFSFMSDSEALSTVSQEPCYLTYTNSATHDILRANLGRSPMYAGEITGTGARYCPSIEDKIVRFADKDRHQIFIEPEGIGTIEKYVQGFSTSMPVDVQQSALNTIQGLEHARIMRAGYAIEYDCIDGTSLNLSLMCKNIKGLFFAGQIVGSSGYEEAAAQGLVAGINASLYLREKQPMILTRDTSYTGVLVDDLVTKGTPEPYRMMTSRAEYRLLLRQDNADTRLTELGRQVGLVTDQRYEKFIQKREKMEKLSDLLYSSHLSAPEASALKDSLGYDIRPGSILADALLREGVSLRMLLPKVDIDPAVAETVEAEIKYRGYIKRQQSEVQKFRRYESKLLPPDIDYSSIPGLRIEARQKLAQLKPESIGRAGRISGVSPSDISVLIVWLAKNERDSHV